MISLENYYTRKGLSADCMVLANRPDRIEMMAAVSSTAQSEIFYCGGVQYSLNSAEYLSLYYLAIFMSFL